MNRTALNCGTGPPKLRCSRGRAIAHPTSGARGSRPMPDRRPRDLVVDPETTTVRDHTSSNSQCCRASRRHSLCSMRLGEASSGYKKQPQSAQKEPAASPGVRGHLGHVAAARTRYSHYGRGGQLDSLWRRPDPVRARRQTHGRRRRRPSVALSDPLFHAQLARFPDQRLSRAQWSYSDRDTPFPTSAKLVRNFSGWC
jgi:hypothetical protein